jgi:deoxyribodipyrimidine photo-lyase
LADNAALTAAAAAGNVLPLYILDDEMPGDWRMGGASRWWLHHSLQALAKRLPLVLRRGRADGVLQEVLRETGATAIYFARDYAPWSAAPERRVKDVAERQGATCHRYGGFLLHEPEAIRTGAGEPYKVYTPFARACFAAGEPKPARPVPDVTWWQGDVRSDELSSLNLLPAAPNWAGGFAAHWTPGEEGARQRLAAFIVEGLTHYAEGRDFPGRTVTSRLSPHLHFGEVSPAQCWRAVQAAANGKNDAAAEKFLKELLWREFSYHLLHHFPHMPEQDFKSEFGGFLWRDDPENLRKWRKGFTGYPIVDAGMRELWATGTMHNRVRMIAASFLIKHLLIDWRHGARWFWDTLVDAGIASNSANWQWVSGSGADAAPYFRIFNPVLQGEKFDGDGAYVRKWVLELARLPNEFIHRPWEAPAAVMRNASIELGRDYPHPVVDHGMARQRALAALKAMKGLE